MSQIEVRSKIIHDWVFPEGVRYREIEGNNEEILKSMLFEIPKNRKNTFIFTLDASDQFQESDEENGVENYFNVLCLKYNKISRRNSDGAIFMVE